MVTVPFPGFVPGPIVHDHDTFPDASADLDSSPLASLSVPLGVRYVIRQLALAAAFVEACAVPLRATGLVTFTSSAGADAVVGAEVGAAVAGFGVFVAFGVLVGFAVLAAVSAPDVVESLGLSASVLQAAQNRSSGVAIGKSRRTVRVPIGEILGEHTLAGGAFNVPVLEFYVWSPWGSSALLPAHSWITASVSGSNAWRA